MKLDKQLRNLLSERGMTLTQLAKLSGVSKQTLSDWASGRTPRRITQIKKVADALAVSIDTLLYGQDSDKSFVPINKLFQDNWISGRFEIRLSEVSQTKRNNQDG